MKYFFVVASLIMLVSGLANTEEMPKLATALIIFGGWGLFKSIKMLMKKDNAVKELDFADAQVEKAEMLQERYEKAVGDYRAIEGARRAIGDIDLSNSLAEMQNISANMLRFLEKNPEKLQSAGKFIDYYQDRARELTVKYAELESMGQNLPDVAKTKQQVKSAVTELKDAYADQFAAIISDRLIDIDAEIKVLRQNMTHDGIGQKAAKINLTKDTAPPVSPSLPSTPKKERPPATPPRFQPPSIIPAHERNNVMFSKILQSCLAIFFGSLGAHKFYQGKKWQGFFYILFFWTTLPGIIGFCEGVRYLFMKLDDFYLEYYLENK